MAEFNIRNSHIGQITDSGTNVVVTGTSADRPDNPKPTAADFEAADAVLGRLTNAPSPGNTAHEMLRNFYASLHAASGTDKFAIRFGLREPRTPLEELE